MSDAPIKVGDLVRFTRSFPYKVASRRKYVLRDDLGIVEADRGNVAPEVRNLVAGGKHRWKIRVVPKGQSRAPAFVDVDDGIELADAPAQPGADALEVVITGRDENYGSVYASSAFRLYDAPFEESVRAPIDKAILAAGYEVNHTRAAYIGTNPSDRPLLIHLLTTAGYRVRQAGAWAEPQTPTT